MTAAYSASTRSAPRNVEYSKAAGVPLYLDAVIPEGDGPFPAAIIVHGGGWVRGDRRVDVAPLFAPLEAAGIASFSIDYRLAADVTQFGVAIDDVKNAILFVRSHAAEYRIDPDRISLVGESAGGQLAAMAALVPAPGAQVNSVVAMYAPTDLVSLANSSGLIPTQIRNSFRGTPFEKFILARLGQLSPIQNISTGAPPFLLIHGTSDPLVPFSQSTAMCDRLQAAGARCKLVPVEGAGHGMRWWEGSASRAGKSYKVEIVRWLKEQSGGPTLAQNRR
jgi:alpha-L-fucosidase 2